VYIPSIKNMSDYWIDELTQIFENEEGVSSEMATGMALIVLEMMKDHGNDRSVDGGNFQEKFGSSVEVYDAVLEYAAQLRQDLLDIQDMGGAITNNRFTGSVRIGAKYEGYKHFKEHETEDFYCPENSYCLFRCIEWYYKLEFGAINRRGINPYNCTKQKLVKRLSEHTDIVPRIPPIFHMKNGKRGYVIYRPVTSKCKKVAGGPIIGLLPCGDGIYHAIVVKNPLKRLPLSAFKFSMTKDLMLTNEWTHMRQSDIPKRVDVVAIYDIETYTTEKPVTRKILDESGTEVEETIIKKYQNPAAIAWQFIELDRDVKGSYTSHRLSPICYTEPIMATDHTEIVKGAKYEEFVMGLVTYCKQHHPELKRIKVYAHNNLGFDAIFSKGCKNLKFVRQTGIDSKMKVLRFHHVDHPDLEIDMCDTKAFVGIGTLKELSKRYAPKEDQKLSFDIVDKSMQWYIDNDNRTNPTVMAETDWLTYLKYDIVSLAHVFIGLEKDYNQIGLSITSHCGLPGAAWTLLSKNMHNINDLTVPYHPSMTAFCRAGTYGARVMALKSRLLEISSQKLISLDNNSLYPTAMTKQFPLGKPTLIPDKKLEDFKNWINSRCNRAFRLDAESGYAKHFMVEIVYKVPEDITISIIPHRTEETLHEPAMLVYPGPGIYQGVYNDVDINEMLLDGYEIIKVVKGLFWTKSGRPFKNVVEKLYKSRQELKEAGDSREYVYKLMLNSLYGKLLEQVRSRVTFSKEPKDKNEADCIEELNNGQWLCYKTLDNPIVSKPCHLGSYVLAHSRAIMNEFIRKLGRENVWYTDTDSLYCTMEDFEKSGIALGGGLGEMKNDYGDGCYITEAVFLDQKKYLLKKVNKDGSTSISTKFLGLGGRLNEQLLTSDFGKAFVEKSGGLDDYPMLFDFYNQLHDDPCNSFRVLRDFWKRNSDNVFIVEKEVKASCNPSKRGNRVPVFDLDASRSNGDEVKYYQFTSMAYNTGFGHLPEYHSCTSSSGVRYRPMEAVKPGVGLAIDYRKYCRSEYQFGTLHWSDPNYGLHLKSGLGVVLDNSILHDGWHQNASMQSTNFVATYCIGMTEAVEGATAYLLFHRLETVKIDPKNGVNLESGRHSHINPANYVFTHGKYQYYHVFYYTSSFGPTVPVGREYTLDKVYPLLHVNQYNVCKFEAPDQEIWPIYEAKFVNRIVPECILPI